MTNNKELDSKSIKKFILNPTNNLEEIITFLEKDFKSTIEGIFITLFPLMKLYN